MPVVRSTLFLPFGLLLLCALQASLAPAAFAHGSVTAEGDLCLIKIGFYTAHFKVFQPDTSQQREFCEDLPAAGESIFVMEYLHQGLADATIEFRIVRDVTGFGRYARLEDLDSVDDLDAITVFHQDPTLQPQVFTALHDFAEAGDFLGIVTVHNPQSGQRYAALFPFSVGFRGWGLLPLFIGMAALTHLTYWISTGGLARRRLLRRARRSANTGKLRFVLVLPLLLLLGVVPRAEADAQIYTSESGKLQLSFSSGNPQPLNKITEWHLQLLTSTGEPVSNASIQVKGGMPAHNHGLATSPVVTAAQDEGHYLLRGLRFHMQGAWVLTLSITYAGTTDTILIPLTI